MCDSRFPFSLNGPPGFYPGWEWNGPYSNAGGGYVQPASIVGPGAYTLSIDNGLCAATSGPMVITDRDCSNCPTVLGEANLKCDPSNPAGYALYLNVANAAPGTVYTFGMDIGPLVPFTVTLPQPTGTYVSLTFSFTALAYTPPPANAEVQVEFVTPSGEKCYEEVSVTVPYPCGWQDQRPAGPSAGDSPAAGKAAATPVATLLGYPNPANTEVTLAYDYGKEDGAALRAITVYDLTGRILHKTVVTDVKGTITLPVGGWAAATYMVRMEEGGKTLLAQRLAVTH